MTSSSSPSPASRRRCVRLVQVVAVYFDGAVLLGCCLALLPSHPVYSSVLIHTPCPY
ncbi:hypothetical protein L210DRAFT_664176 [Boletus edulis BED1]|uniref:Uncharacterized protein n=1 Tax=Boletus edulis BED1 TaxID=1328754 RepID=A0AAD4BZY3_BOLED|nr:hypothetical protein L210DRAFT_664176 [Boletus edulis BED1]